VLLLQKSFAKSKAKDHTTYLEHHLALWHADDFSALENVFGHLQSAIHRTGHSSVARTFDRLMSMGKVSVAVKLLSANAKGGVLSLDYQISCGVDNDGCPLTQGCPQHPLREWQFLNPLYYLIYLMYHLNV